MTTIRPEEGWARECIRSALGDVEVRHRDDGSQPRIYDLEILYSDRSLAAAEVTAAADAESIELWNVINGDGRWVEPDLVGGCSVALVPQARARRLREDLPALLKKLEQQGVREVVVDPWRRGPLVEEASSLGITHLYQGPTDYRGSIYPTIELPSERSGGMVDDNGEALPRWLNEWIRQPNQADNLQKLRDSGADESHLFVILPGFADAPFAVTDLLMREGAPLPTLAPSLPSPVTHVWAISTWSSGSGMRWSPDLGWFRFEKVAPEAERSERPKRGGDQPKDLSRETTESEDGHRQMGEGNR
jgi:hypothetical protein